MRNRVLLAVSIFTMILTFLMAQTKKAEALVCPVEECDAIAYLPCLELPWSFPVTGYSAQFSDHLINEFTAAKAIDISTFFEDNFLPALMMLTDQIALSSMQQMQAMGMFMDAKHQMETQRVMQVLKARAHKDYQPSEGMCEFGSSVKSLAASDRRVDLTAHVLSQRAFDRELGNANNASAGPDGVASAQDIANRISQFQDTYCDPNDNNTGLAGLCQHKNGVGVSKDNAQRVNNDIDFARVVDVPWTLNVDFSDDELQNNEEDIFALASNLYGFDVTTQLNNDVLNGPFPPNNPNDPYFDELTTQREIYMDMRASQAKRSVAQNSFSAIVAMKAAGSEGSRDFMKAIVKELGVDNDRELNYFLGVDDDGNEIGPSYFAQMEVLTKKIYQNPDFYTNLYDKPANVERKQVAMQAIGLMQKFDLYRSYLRAEANTSILLELALEEQQIGLANAK